MKVLASVLVAFGLILAATTGTTAPTTIVAAPEVADFPPVEYIEFEPLYITVDLQENNLTNLKF